MMKIEIKPQTWQDYRDIKYPITLYPEAEGGYTVAIALNNHDLSNEFPIFQSCFRRDPKTEYSYGFDRSSIMESPTNPKTK